MIEISPKPVVSIVIPTRNRCGYLDKLISSICRQTFPLEDYEIIVVDNGSEDDTANEVNRLQGLFDTRMTYLYEPRPGANIARNTGNMAARGDILAYIDDDAFAAPEWLMNLVKDLVNDEEVVCVSGRIDLSWQAPRPAWLPVELESYLGCNHHLGFAHRELTPEEVVFEGSFATRRALVLEAGGYNVKFGMVGNQIRLHDGTTLVDSLREKGKIIYTPDAVVYHIVPAWRAQKRYLLKRSFRQGMGDANLAQVRQPRTIAGLFRALAADVIFLLKDLWHLLISIFSGIHNRIFYWNAVCMVRIGAMWQRVLIIKSSFATNRL
jgi:glucosyl-dolichyl phosphate glucuronosyltransferase